MTFIMLYADLASAGLLKKGPEFARQLGYDPDEIRKYQAKWCRSSANAMRRPGSRLSISTYSSLVWAPSPS